jgi:hypothetical protein
MAGYAFAYRLEPNDLAAGRRLAAPDLTRAVWFWPGVTGAALLGVWAVGAGSGWGIAGANGGAAAFWLGGLALQAWRLSRPTGPGRDMRLTVDAAGVSVDGAAPIAWNRVSHIHDSDRHVALIVHGAPAVIAPKSVIGDVGRVDDFIAACQAWSHGGG